MSYTQRSLVANKLERDRSTPSEEKRAKQLRIERTFAFSEQKCDDEASSLNANVECIANDCKVLICSHYLSNTVVCGTFAQEVSCRAVQPRLDYHIRVQVLCYPISIEIGLD